VMWQPISPNSQYSATGPTMDFLWYKHLAASPARVRLTVIVEDTGGIDHVSFPDLPAFTTVWSIPSGSNIVTVGTPTGTGNRWTYSLDYEFNGLASNPDEALFEIRAVDVNGTSSTASATIEPDGV